MINKISNEHTNDNVTIVEIYLRKAGMRVLSFVEWERNPPRDGDICVEN